MANVSFIRSTGLVKMRALLVLVIATLFHRSLAYESNTVTCSDMKQKVLGWILNKFSSDTRKVIDVRFYLATNRHREPASIDLAEWTQLTTNEFDVSKKTFLITHGFWSEGLKPWVLDMKDAILNNTDGNIIIVDWSDGGKKKNYVNAAKNTVTVSNRVFNFLQTLRAKVVHLNGTSNQVLYNHLHLIGHSLGAHVCGQTAHLLKSDSFWKIERITGLDPAKPCFNNVSANLRVDKENADFVDIIHTQIGKGFYDGFGLAANLGHVDFYLNGGIVQPQCQGNTMNYVDMICSHKLATTYFIESIKQDKAGSLCRFPISRWNGSYLDAQIRISFLKRGMDCKDCPKMGLSPVNSKQYGIFLVLTSSHQPYCGFNPEKDLQKIIPGIKKLRGIKSIFDTRKPDKEDGVLVIL